GHHRALGGAATSRLSVGLVPGRPRFASLSLAASTGYAPRPRRRRPPGAEASERAGAALPPPRPAATAGRGGGGRDPGAPLGRERGYRLIPLVDTAEGGELMARIKAVRRKLTQGIGFLIPPVHIRDNLELAPNAYAVQVHGVPVAKAEVHPDRLLALDPGGAM